MAETPPDGGGVVADSPYLDTPPDFYAPPPPTTESTSTADQETSPPSPHDEPASSGGYSKASDPDEMLMCRVCRGNEGNLYYPCLCTGSIKYVHQECLVEWLKYSKKEVCELCNHKYSFQPIYRQDTPKVLPVLDIAKGIMISLAKVVKTWLMYTLVMSAWLGIVPLTAARIYNCVFYLTLQDILSAPVHFFKVDHIAQDIFKGSMLLVLFVCTFISLVWLREQIILGGPAHFLNIDAENNTGDEDGNSSGDDESEEDDEFDDDGTTDEAATDEEDEQEVAFLMERAPTPGPALNAEEVLEEMLQDNDQEAPAEGAAPANEEAVVEDGVPGPNVVDELINEPPNEEDIQLPLRPNRNRPRRERNAARAVDADNNWQDWDRFGEELTWQRLLGLDGSLVFLEHVFWVISLNTLFTVVFAYMPYRFGHLVLTFAGIQSKIVYFPSVASIICGYVIIAGLTYCVHKVVGLLKLKLLFRFLGIMFLILKVFLLVLMEIGFFPVMCGCWMDICTLPLFSVTLSQRIATFAASPFMSIFLHWMIGMVYVFYSASFVILLREILRPGVLWFMRNLNDPDFNPIQEMIELPFTRHLRRLVVSTTLFFTTILLIFYIPLKAIQNVIPSVLPYNVSMSADTPLSELSLELLVLQIILPAVLEQTHGRIFIKVVVRKWCVLVGKILNLDRYLLSDTNNNNMNDGAARAAPAAAAGGGLAAEHQALLLLREPRAYEPYVRPNFFPLRIVALLVLMALSTTFTSVCLFVVPAMVGRLLIYLATGQTNIHEIYSVGMGLYFCWLCGKVSHLTLKFFKGGVNYFRDAVVNYSWLALRILLVCIPIVFVLPMLIGTYFQLTFLTPFRLTENQTALYFPYQDWAMGVLQIKIIAVVVMMGPDWWLKTELETIHNRGFDNFCATHIFMRLLVPVILYMATLIAFPVVFSTVYTHCFGLGYESSMLLLRFSYPITLFLALCVLFFHWQLGKFRELTEKIKNDRYLVGTQLVNYERNNGTKTP